MLLTTLYFIFESVFLQDVVCYNYIFASNEHICNKTLVPQLWCCYSCYNVYDSSDCVNM